MSIWGCEVVNLGHNGDHLAKDIIVNVSGLLTKWPEASIDVIVRRPGEDTVYIASTDIVAGYLYWHVTASDTAIVGDGQAEMVATTQDGRVAYSCTVKTRVRPSMDGIDQEEPPEPAKWWVEKVVEAAASAESSAEAAETAQGKAEDAQGAAETAQTAAETAASAAAGSATAAAGSASDAAGSASSAAASATAAETAQGKAKDAQAAAETAASSIRNAGARATTLAEGSSATAQVVDESGTKVFVFGIPVGATGATGNGIASVALNADYTLTVNYTNGGSYTTEIPIRGAQGQQGADGEDGTGIAGAVLNADYTLTLTFTNGTTYTTPSIRGAQGERGSDGAVVSIGAYEYSFAINSSGRLILTYGGEDAPDLAINSNGHLIYTID